MEIDNRSATAPPRAFAGSKLNPVGAQTVQWISIDASGRERVNRHARRVEVYERHRRVQVLAKQRRKNYSDVLDAARLLHELLPIVTAAMVAAIVFL